MRTFGLVLLVFCVFPASTLMAQATSTTEQPGKSRCFRGQPLPTCNSFWITEIGFLYGLVTPLLGMREYPTLELGMMANVGEHSAIGGTLYGGLLHGLELGVKARYRRWLSNSTSIDFSPGILLDAGDRKSPGFTGHIGMNFGDRLSLVSQCEVVTSPWHWDGVHQVSRRVPGVGPPPRNWLFGGSLHVS